ncbi:MAG: hypothetical protein LBS91_07480, partial [Clostridiales Family XIII bacterium]|nr:hypothetical protein [Clostridiales Family XIII bacterium]
MTMAATERERAVSYLAEGHALLRAHGLYGAAEGAHTFALDRALSNFARRGGFPGAAEAAAALQALYEAKRFVTARSSVEGRRIILGDYFICLAVKLALPLRDARLAALVSDELCGIGRDVNRAAARVSKKSFCATVDRFTETLCGGAAGTDVSVIASEAKQSIKTSCKPGFLGLPRRCAPRNDGLCDSAAVIASEAKQSIKTSCKPGFLGLPRRCAPRNDGSAPFVPEVGASFANAALSYQENKLLSALESGWFKSAAAETRRALAEM